MKLKRKVAEISEDELTALAQHIANREFDKALGFIEAKRMECGYLFVSMRWKR